MGYKQYCKCYEKIENFEKAAADDFKGWECHHRLETHTSSGERRIVDISAAELKALGMYYNRPAEELVFLTSREHTALHKKGKHNPFYGKHHTEESKKKISEARKGEKNSFYGKHHTEESKKKISEARKGEKNPFYGKQLTEEHKKKLSKARKGTHFFNNGKINVRVKECPPGFIPGRIIKKP